MICINVWRRGKGIELLARGHAGYDVAGRDIVCAGVSALLYGFKGYLEEQSLLCHRGHVDCAQWNGGLWMRCRGFGGLDVRAWEVTREGLSLIAREYARYVRIEERSCKEEEPWKKW